MQLKKRILNSVAVIFLTCISLFVFSILQLFGKQESLDSIPLPKDTTWIIKFEASNFWKEEVYTTLFDEKDEQFLTSLKQLSKDRFQTNKKGSLGIDLNTDIILSGFQLHNKSYNIVLINLNNTFDFNKNISNYLTNNQIGGTIENTGIVIIPSTQKTSKSELLSVLEIWQNAPLSKRESIKYDNGDLFSYKQLKHSGKSSIQRLEIGVKQHSNSVHLNGKCSFTSGSIEQFSYDLKPSGFYISSRIIPLNFEDTLNKYMPLGSFKFSKINGFVMDFNGVYLEEEKTGMPEIFGYLPIPKINLIISCKEKISIKSILNACPSSIIGAENTLNFGETNYLLEQLDEYTIFIGIDPSVILKKNQKNVFSIKGELTYLTKIDGNSFVSSVAQNMGPMRLANNFLKATTELDITVKQSTKDVYIIKGDLTFKEGKKPLHELSKLFISLSTIK